MFINIIVFSRTRYVGEAFTVKKSVIIYHKCCICACVYAVVLLLIGHIILFLQYTSFIKAVMTKHSPVPKKVSCFHYLSLCAH